MAGIEKGEQAAHDAYLRSGPPDQRMRRIMAQAPPPAIGEFRIQDVPPRQEVEDITSQVDSRRRISVGRVVVENIRWLTVVSIGSGFGYAVSQSKPNNLSFSPTVNGICVGLLAAGIAYVGSLVIDDFRDGRKSKVKENVLLENKHEIPHEKNSDQESSE